MSDFKSNEYASLLGGKWFEPSESNPMIGFRGASRYTYPAWLLWLSICVGAGIMLPRPYIHFGEKVVTKTGDNKYSFQVPVYLDDLSPEAVRVELYTEPREVGKTPELIVMSRGKQFSGTVNGYQYLATIISQRPVDDYTSRVIPYHRNAKVPLENNHIFWYR